MHKYSLVTPIVIRRKQHESGIRMSVLQEGCCLEYTKQERNSKVRTIMRIRGKDVGQESGGVCDVPCFMVDLH